MKNCNLKALKELERLGYRINEKESTPNFLVMHGGAEDVLATFDLFERTLYINTGIDFNTVRLFNDLLNELVKYDGAIPWWQTSQDRKDRVYKMARIYEKENNCRLDFEFIGGDDLNSYTFESEFNDFAFEIKNHFLVGSYINNRTSREFDMVALSHLWAFVKQVALVDFQLPEIE